MGERDIPEDWSSARRTQSDEMTRLFGNQNSASRSSGVPATDSSYKSVSSKNKRNSKKLGLDQLKKADRELIWHPFSPLGGSEYDTFHSARAPCESVDGAHTSCAWYAHSHGTIRSRHWPVTVCNADTSCWEALPRPSAHP